MQRCRKDRHGSRKAGVKTHPSGGVARYARMRSETGPRLRHRLHDRCRRPARRGVGVEVPSRAAAERPCGRAGPPRHHRRRGRAGRPDRRLHGVADRRAVVRLPLRRAVPRPQAQPDRRVVAGRAVARRRSVRRVGQFAAAGTTQAATERQCRRRGPNPSLHVQRVAS